MQALANWVEKVCEIIANTCSVKAQENVSAVVDTSSALTPINEQQASELLERLPTLADGEVSQLLERLLRGQGN